MTLTIIFVLLLLYLFYLDYYNNSLFEDMTITEGSLIETSFDKIKQLAKNINNCDILYNNLYSKTRSIVYKDQIKINKFFNNFKLSIDKINYNENDESKNDPNKINGEIIVSYEFTTINEKSKKYNDSNKKINKGNMIYYFNGNINKCIIKLGNYKQS
jgi:hypothetical protein